MNLTLLQILLIVLISFTFTRVYLRAKEGKMEQGAVIFWVLVWLTALVVVVAPDLVSEVARWFGVGRGVDAVLYVSIVILFYLVFRTNVALENIRQDLTELVRDSALKELNGNNRIKVQAGKRK